jgi:hypothetical protein
MTAPAGRRKSHALSVLASAGITTLAIGAMAMIWPSPSAAQTDPPTTPTTSSTPTWDGSRWTAPTADGETLSDGTFSGTFVYEPGTPPIASVDLSVTYASGDVHPTACGVGPGQQPQQVAPTSTTPSTTGPAPSTMDFLFEVAFTCNGLYDATATATLAPSEPPSEPPPSELTTHELRLQGLRVAVPPERPRSFRATDNGNLTVSLTWEPPTQQPPDLAGYRLSRRESSSQSFTTVAETPLGTESFDDTNVPAGSYFYKVETLRDSPNGALPSAPVITSEALAVGGGGGTPGRSVGGVAAPRRPDGNGSGGTGTQHFDESTTLAADEGEPGEGDLAVPGGGTIQRFAGREGAGLIKPFAAALDLAVWAGLLLFLTRRAASAERADRLGLELEHPTQQYSGAGLVEGLVPVAAFGGLDTGGAPISAPAAVYDFERGGEVTIGDFEPEFGDARAAWVPVVDEDRGPTRVRLQRRRYATYVPTIADGE